MISARHEKNTSKCENANALLLDGAELINTVVTFILVVG